MKQQSDNEIWNYQQIDLGFNYRMNDIQAALGLNQMKRLDKFVRQRHKIANLYNSELKELPLTLPWQSPLVYSSYHLYPIIINLSLSDKTQKEVYIKLRKNGIAVNLHYIPVHRHPYYENLGFKKNDFPEAEKFYQKVISIPMFAILNDIDQEYVVETLKKVMAV